VNDGRDFLFVQSATEIGGAETVLSNLFSASEELRRRSLVVSLGFGQGTFPARLRAVGAEVIEIRPARLRDPLGVARTVMSVRRLVRARAVKVVVGNGAHPQVTAGLAARAAGARSAFMVHMIHAHPVWKNHPIDSLAVRGPCDLMFALSKASETTLRRIRPRLDVRLLYPGTRLGRVGEAERRAARQKLGAPDGDDTVLFGVFGRLQRWKGQDVFVEAAARAAAAEPRARFAIVGGSVFGLETEFLRELEERVRALGLGDRLVLTGFREDVPALMAACDVVCHTTRVAEPFGMVIIEAMAQGRPVVCTNGGGPAEIVRSGEDGLLIPPDDPDALARTMLALAGDGDLRRRLGEAALRTVRERFDIAGMAEGLLRHLDALAGAG
jgi:glycosyltransferase involved in cell wall biosynthesis